MARLAKNHPVAVQDLTPQLRTRLSRVERAVGVFVSLATLLLIAGFAYYVYQTGQRKGWWTFKARYHIFVESGAGLSIGGDVRLLGFNVGKITEVTAMEPFSTQGAVYVQFYVLDPFPGYIWTDSGARVASGDLLGGRVIEVIPGGSSLKTNENAVLKPTYLAVDGEWMIYNPDTGEYNPEATRPKGYSLVSGESPAITDRLERIAAEVELALPGIFDLTNRANLILSNVATLTAEAQTALTQVQPVLTNAAVITANLRDPQGSLGEWILPTNLHAHLLETISAANLTLTNAGQFLTSTDSNLTTIATDLDHTLINLANITSNLNQQVQSNTNLVKSLSDLITNADTLIQGLKTHWLLRSAFRNREEPAAEEQQEQPARRPPPRAGKWREYP